MVAAKRVHAPTLPGLTQRQSDGVRVVLNQLREIEASFRNPLVTLTDRDAMLLRAEERLFKDFPNEYVQPVRV